MSENFMDFLRKRWYIVVIVVVVICGLCVGGLVLWGVTGPFERFLDGDTAAESATIAPATTESEAADDEGAPATPTPTAIPEAPQQELVGTYGVAVRAVLGDLSHVVYIALHRWLTLNVHHSDISFDAPDPWVNVSGTLEDDGSFMAEGRGTVAGYADIAVVFEGSLIFDAVRGDFVLTGDYTMGAEGGLPGGESVTYHVEGFRMSEPGEDTVSNSETVAEFAPALAEAVRTQDNGFLLGRLHPAASAFYGTEQCQTYVTGLDDPAFNIEVLEVSGPDEWLWEQGGQSATVPDVYTVLSNVTSGTQTIQTEAHFALVEGELTWLPICGEVVP